MNRDHERALANAATLTPGWDGAMADPPGPDAIRYARGLVPALAEKLGAWPAVYPLAAGPGIDLEWDSPAVSVEVHPDGSLLVYFWVGDKRRATLGLPEGAAGDPEAAADTVARVAAVLASLVPDP
jgi:hypothetical protein